MWRLLLLFLLLACKQLHIGKVKTQKTSYAQASCQRSLDLPDSLLLSFNKLLECQEKLEEEKRPADDLLLHHVRSIIAYAVHSSCFKVPHVKVRDINKELQIVPVTKHYPIHAQVHLLQKSWRDKYDYNFYLRGKPTYEYQLVVATQRLCSIFIAKMLEFQPQPPSTSNADFFKNVIENKVPLLGRDSYSEQEQFFRHALAPRILKITSQSMAHTDFLFPFHRYDYAKACQQQRDYILPDEHSRQYRYSQSVRQKIDCTALQQLPEVETNNYEDINCEEPHMFAKTTVRQPYASLSAVTDDIKTTITALNKHRAELNEMVKLKTLVSKKIVDRGKRGRTIEEKYEPLLVTKKPWIMPFLKVLNATKTDHDSVLPHLDAYNCHVVKAGKRGTLPLIFAPVTQKQTGSLHLNHMGRFFGFGKVEYKPLQLPPAATIAQAMNITKLELVKNWVELQAAMATKEKLASQKIYATLLNNELAVAQLLLENPQHALVVSHLLNNFSQTSYTPKWLQTYKDITMSLDLAFVPLVILGGIATGGVGFVPLMLMATAVNFLWVGAANTDAIIARHRYRLAQRALMTGNSEQVARGMQLLRKLHERQRDQITSAASTPLTVANLALIAKGLESIATLPIDITAAVGADIETLTMDTEQPSDTELHVSPHE